MEHGIYVCYHIIHLHYPSLVSSMTGLARIDFVIGGLMSVKAGRVQGFLLGRALGLRRGLCVFSERERGGRLPIRAGLSLTLMLDWTTWGRLVYFLELCMREMHDGEEVTLLTY